VKTWKRYKELLNRVIEEMSNRYTELRNRGNEEPRDREKIAVSEAVEFSLCPLMIAGSTYSSADSVTAAAIGLVCLGGRGTGVIQMLIRVFRSFVVCLAEVFNMLSIGWQGTVESWNLKPGDGQKNRR
jgi:hypothetical protein